MSQRPRLPPLRQALGSEPSSVRRHYDPHLLTEPSYSIGREHQSLTGWPSAPSYHSQAPFDPYQNFPEGGMGPSRSLRDDPMLAQRAAARNRLLPFDEQFSPTFQNRRQPTRPSRDRTPSPPLPAPEKSMRADSMYQSAQQLTYDECDQRKSILPSALSRPPKAHRAGKSPSPSMSELSRLQISDDSEDDQSSKQRTGAARHHRAFGALQPSPKPTLHANEPEAASPLHIKREPTTRKVELSIETASAHHFSGPLRAAAQSSGFGSGHNLGRRASEPSLLFSRKGTRSFAMQGMHPFAGIEEEDPFCTSPQLFGRPPPLPGRSQPFSNPILRKTTSTAFQSNPFSRHAQASTSGIMLSPPVFRDEGASSAAPPMISSGHGPFGNKYACELCSRSFARPSALATHMNVHTGDRPHECPLCGRRFSVASNLRRHVKLHQAQSQEDARRLA